MNDRRRAIVLKAFNIMDRDGSGYIDLADVKGVFNASKHPEVLLGKISADDALVTFLQGLEGRSGNGDGRISKEEWLDYYAGEALSSCNGAITFAVLTDASPSFLGCRTPQTFRLPSQRINTLLK